MDQTLVVLCEACRGSRAEPPFTCRICGHLTDEAAWTTAARAIDPLRSFASILSPERRRN
jgi:hypothetical protein